MLPFKSLDGATAPGQAAVRDLEGVFARHTLVAYLTDDTDGDAAVVVLQGSHDGVIWSTLASVSLAAVNSVLQGVSTTPEPGHLVRFVRAELLASGIEGTPTVTATIASGE